MSIRRVIATVLLCGAGVAFLTTAHAQRPTLGNLQDQVDELESRIEALESTSDGVVLIDQAKALEGGVTPGDEPGFPVFISAPGSFRLTGNLDPNDPPPQSPIDNVIAIGATGVTLDLNGFSIIAPGGAGMPRGITGGSHITVRNGTVRGTKYGIDISDHAIVTDVHLVDNFFGGVRVGSQSIVSDCVILGGGAFPGIDANKGSIVRGNTVIETAGVGILAVESLVVENTVRESGVGVQVGFGGSVRGNSLSNNGTGVRFGQLGAKSAFSQNVLTENTQDIFGTEFIDLGDNVCGDDLVCP